MTNTPTRASSVTLKIAMAVTGLILAGFVILHAYGNLKMFSGADAYNGYAAWLRELGSPALGYGMALWILRVVLLIAVVVHIIAGMTLWSRANRARGNAYKVSRGTKTSGSFTTQMQRLSGLGIGLFVVFHILHFTTLTIEVGGDYSELTPHERMAASFDHWWLYLIYLLAVLALMFHLAHGLASAMSSLGWMRTGTEKLIKALAGVAALVVALAFLAPPTALLFGWI